MKTEGTGVVLPAGSIPMQHGLTDGAAEQTGLHREVLPQVRHFQDRLGVGVQRKRACQPIPLVTLSNWMLLLIEIHGLGWVPSFACKTVVETLPE